MSGRLAEVAALVTGGGSGIGRGVVEAYLAEGAEVIVVERSADHAEQLLRDHPGVDVLVGDATDAALLAAAVGRAQSTGRPSAQLTCCVGVHDSFASLRELTPVALTAAAQDLWSTNVLSALLAVNAAYPWLARSSGSVTLTVSESAFHNTGGGVLYGSSKWALRGVVAHLSADLAPQVRVNGVSPGGTTGTRFAGSSTLGTPTPADEREGRDQLIADGNVLGVVPTPDDHAGAYVYLADPVAARVVTGVVIPTDGGRR
jgi:2,3-dihydroxy-2,3-dihydrophenylpropionate dehydrogenase